MRTWTAACLMYILEISVRRASGLDELLTGELWLLEVMRICNLLIAVLKDS